MNHWKDAIVCACNDAYGDVRGVEVKVRGLCKDEVAPRGYGDAPYGEAGPGRNYCSSSVPWVYEQYGGDTGRSQGAV